VSYGGVIRFDFEIYFST